MEKKTNKDILSTCDIIKYNYKWFEADFGHIEAISGDNRGHRS